MELPVPIKIVKRDRREHIAANQPNTVIIDVTSHGRDPWVQLSPFYPHGRIPVPFSEGSFSQTVEGVWQALKVFERADIDPAKLNATGVAGLKRRESWNGRILGHRAGLHGQDLLGYEAARRRIYLPTYRHVLESRTAGLIRLLRVESGRSEVVLLDFTTNGDVCDLSSPLSHAALIAMHVCGTWPAEG